MIALIFMNKHPIIVVSILIQLISPLSQFTLWRSQQPEQNFMENNNIDPNSTEGGPNTSEQSTRTNNTQTTTSERMKRSKYKIPILSDRETNLTKINPKMWWEQISEYIHVTYNRNLDEIIDERTNLWIHTQPTT